jgi:hypothetical protein
MHVKEGLLHQIHGEDVIVELAAGEAEQPGPQRLVQRGERTVVPGRISLHGDIRRDRPTPTWRHL